MSREVILETRDGWRKHMKLYDNLPYVRVPVMAARDFELNVAAMVDPTRTASFRYMEFDWDGQLEEFKMPDGTVGAIEVWRER